MLYKNTAFTSVVVNIMRFAIAGVNVGEGYFISVGEYHNAVADEIGSVVYYGDINKCILEYGDGQNTQYYE